MQLRAVLERVENAGHPKALERAAGVSCLDGPEAECDVPFGRPGFEKRLQEVQLAHRVLDRVGREAAEVHGFPDRGPDCGGHARAYAQPRHRPQRPRPLVRRDLPEEAVEDGRIGRVHPEENGRGVLGATPLRWQEAVPDARAQWALAEVRAGFEENLLPIGETGQAVEGIPAPGNRCRMGRQARGRR